VLNTLTEHDFQDSLKMYRSCENVAYARKMISSRLMMASRPKGHQMAAPVPEVMDTID
jgi:hypothetical protein